MQTGFSEFDDVLVAIGQRTVQQYLFVQLTLVDLLRHGHAVAKARVERTTGLPAIAQDCARGIFAD